MLLYGLMNPVRVIPIYLRLEYRGASARARCILLIAASAVTALLTVLISAALPGLQILSFFFGRH